MDDLQTDNVTLTRVFCVFYRQLLRELLHLLHERYLKYVFITPFKTPQKIAPLIFQPPAYLISFHVSRFKDFPVSVLVVLRNAAFVFVTLSGVADGLITTGLSTFLPKMIESLFNVSSSNSSTIVGRCRGEVPFLACFCCVENTSASSAKLSFGTSANPRGQFDSPPPSHFSSSPSAPLVYILTTLSRLFHLNYAVFSHV